MLVDYFIHAKISYAYNGSQAMCSVARLYFPAHARNTVHQKTKGMLHMDQSFLILLIGCSPSDRRSGPECNGG